MQQTWGGQMAWLSIEIIWKLHFSSLSKQFLYVFFLSSSFFPHLSFFFLFGLPLARLVISGGQNVSPLVSLQNFQAIVLNTLEAPLADFFFVSLSKEFLAISHNFELNAFILVSAVQSSVHASLPQVAAWKTQVLGIFAMYLCLRVVYIKPGTVTGGIKSTYNLWFK